MTTGPVDVDSTPRNRPSLRIVEPEPVFSALSPLRAIARSCQRIAASDATVLLTGETGTGKEVFARLFHRQSRRSTGPFVAVNCAAIPEALLESELFGHAKGAFTGALNARKGRFASAQGGTLFLDEVGELPVSLQVKLLRVLQERTFDPVGATESVQADFRLVAATNRDLEAEVEAGRFRRDLYYRLMVCPIELPPLRERQSDIPALFFHFWRARGESRQVAPQVIGRLLAHSWPGNVRELENLVERLSVCAEGTTIEVEDLPPALRLDTVLSPAATAAAISMAPDRSTGGFSKDLSFADRVESATSPFLDLSDLKVQLPVDLPALMRRIEQTFIAAALEQTGGNKKVAADLLCLQRTTLVEKLRRNQASETQTPAVDPQVMAG